MLDSKGLTDDELKASLLKHGVRAGPIVGEYSVMPYLKMYELVS